MKKSLVLFAICVVFCQNTNATNYYVRTDGSDSNIGTTNTPTGAWKTINSALYGYCNWGSGPTGQGTPMLPGDTLFVNDGLYQEDGFTYGLKIDGINGSNTNRFVIKAVNKWAARLELSSQYNAFNILNSKGITVDGFDIFAPATSTNIYSGINIDNSEFVTVRNCKIHNFGLSAIGGDGSNIIVENNVAYDNSIRNAGNGSAINFYHPKKISNNTLAGGYGHIIRGNIVYHNYCDQFYTSVTGNYGPPTDGNGIIIDDWNFSQPPYGPAYKVPCLIENNVCFDNGGAGINIYDSDNVTVRNNTCYNNSWVLANYSSATSPTAGIIVGCEPGLSNNITVVNNLSMVNTALNATTTSGIRTDANVTNITIKNNFTNRLYYPNPPEGNNNVIGANAQFINAGIDPATANFRLLNNSPAINIGLNTNAAATDIDGVARPIGATVDAGAYESSCTVSAGTIAGTTTLLVNATSNLTSNGTAGGTWSSSNTAIATVSASGVVTGVGIGTATITYAVSSGDCSSSTTATVMINSAYNTTITVRARSVTDAGANFVVEIMNSASPTVTTVVQSQVFNNLPTTFADYTFSANSVVNADKVRVRFTNDVGNRDFEVDYITVSGTTFQTEAATTYSIGAWNPTNGCLNSGYFSISTIYCEGYFHFMASNAILPNAGTIGGTTTFCVGTTSALTSNGLTGGTWSSSNTAVATISASGIVTTVSAGTSTITYTVSANGNSANTSTNITVNALPNAGTIAGTTTLCVGTTSALTSNGLAGGTWTSSNPAVATISTTGVVTSVSAGTSAITYAVSVNACSANTSATITVNALPNAGTIAGTTTLCVGTTSALTSNGLVGGTWSSSNIAVASVSATGVVTSVSAGISTITYVVSANGCSKSTFASVSVNSLPNAGTISGKTSFKIGTISTLTSNGLAGGSWTSANNAVATVSSTGVVTGISIGTAAISYTVTAKGCSANATKNVTITAVNTSIIIRARSVGTAGCNMTVEVMNSSAPTGGTVLQSKNFSNLSTTFANYTFTATGAVSANRIRVRYTNDISNRDMEIDYTTVGGITCQTEANSTYEIGVWTNATDGCSVGGYYSSSILQCTGYVHYLTAIPPSIIPKIGGSGTTTNTSLKLYPNPVSFSRDITLYLNAIDKQDLYLHFFDMRGQQVYYSHQSMVEGENMLIIPASIPKGAYLLYATYGNKVETLKFIVTD